MGNQNTSGIVVEEGAGNGAPEKAQEATSPDALKEEKQVQVQDDKTKGFQEKDGGSLSHDTEAGNSPPDEGQTSGEKEEADGSVNEVGETQAAALPNVSGIFFEPNELNLEDGIPKCDNESHHQPCHLKGEIQTSGSNLEGTNSTSTITNLNCLPLDAVNTASEPEEDQKKLVKWTAETLDSCHIEVESRPADIKIAQDLTVSAIPEIDVERSMDDLVMADMYSDKGAVLELGTDKEEVAILTTDDDNENGIRKGSTEVVPSKEQQNDLSSVSLPDLFVADNEKEDEYLVPAEEKLMLNGLTNRDPRSSVDEYKASDHTINRFMNCSDALPVIITSDMANNGEEPAVKIVSLSHPEKVDLADEVKPDDERDQTSRSDSLNSIPIEELEDTDEFHEMVKEIGLVQPEGLITVAENQEDDKSTDEWALREATSCATGNDRDNHTSTLKKGQSQSQSQSLLKINTVTKFELGQEAQALSSTISGAEIPPSLSDDQCSNSETPILHDRKAKAHQSTESLSFELNPSNIGVQVELRKSPSFNFGLPLDARSEASDQTPLLCQDRTAARSLSSSSTLRFQSRSVQTEYFGKSLQYEPVEVEEKTIRMERSNSESSRAPFLKLPNKEEKANVVMKAKPETSSCNKTQEESGLKASPSREDCARISPKGNGKRKPRSFFFPTCMCCTAALS